MEILQYIIIPILMLILTFILAITTVFYALETRKLRLQKETPYIIPYLQSTEDHDTIILHIKNFGEGVGKNVKIIFLKDFNRFENTEFPLSGIGISKNGFATFPPNYDLATAIGWTQDLFEKYTGTVIKLEVSYSSLDGKRKFHNIFELPIRQLEGIIYTVPQSLKQS